MNKNYSKIFVLFCSFAFTLLSGCSNTQSPQARVADDVRGLIDSRVPNEEQEIMSNVLSSLPDELRSAETIVYVDNQGQHSNTLKVFNEIKSGEVGLGFSRGSDDVSQFLDPRLPDEEKVMMSDVLRLGSTEVGEVVTFIDSKGQSHSNTLEGYNRIKAGGGLVVSEGSMYPYDQKSK